MRTQMGKVNKYRIIFDGVYYKVEKQVNLPFTFGLLKSWVECPYFVMHEGKMWAFPKISSLDLACRILNQNVNDQENELHVTIRKRAFA